MLHHMCALLRACRRVHESHSTAARCPLTTRLRCNMDIIPRSSRVIPCSSVTIPQVFRAVPRASSRVLSTSTARLAALPQALGPLTLPKQQQTAQYTPAHAARAFAHLPSPHLISSPFSFSLLCELGSLIHSIHSHISLPHAGEGAPLGFLSPRWTGLATLFRCSTHWHGRLYLDISIWLIQSWRWRHEC